MDEYYTPKLEEFVQGFKYQIKSIKEGDCIWNTFNFKTDPATITPIYAYRDYWEDAEVWWDRKPRLITSICNDGTKITYKENPKWDLHPSYDIETYLNNGMIRAKRND